MTQKGILTLDEKDVIVSHPELLVYWWMSLSFDIFLLYFSVRYGSKFTQGNYILPDVVGTG